MAQSGKIILVATPIGNLGDMSERARDALRDCDVIYCEDTRVTRRLLSLIGVDKNTLRLDENIIDSKIEEVIERARSGERVCYCSDAGMPGISDPGSKIVCGARESGVLTEVLPGPCAATVAFVASGFSTTQFHFAGFLPKKKLKREETLRELLQRDHATIIYESPKRILETLSMLPSSRRVCVARELTKLHEEILVGTAQELSQELSSRDTIKGEIVIVINTASTHELECTDEEKLNIAKAYVRKARERNLSSTDIKNDLIDFFDIQKNLAFELANNR